MKNKHHLLAILIHLIGITLYLTPLFKLSDGIGINGYQAMGVYWISIAIYILMVIPVSLHALAFINQDMYKKTESVLIFLMNILIIFAALLITYFSNIVNMYTYLLVGVIVTSVYNQYRIKH
jgi:hypothetical protein